MAAVRADWSGPILVEPFSMADLPEIAASADGVVVGAAWMQDFQLVRAVARLGLPVLVQRGPSATLEEWLAIADYCVAEGNDQVVLCESGSRTHLAGVTLDLALMRAAREKSGRPVLADLGGDPALAAAAVAAGTHGLLLSPDATEQEALAAHEAVKIVGAVTRREPRLRLAARDASTASTRPWPSSWNAAPSSPALQRLKPVGGFAGRDMDRERRLVAEMARRAPSLGEARLAPIMNAVIEAGLHLAEERMAAGRD